MAELLQSTTLWAVVLTLAAYQAALWLRKKWNSPLCNPIVVSVVLVAAVLLLLKLPNEEYQRLAARYFPYGNRWLWTMLQYKQMKGMAGENGRAVLRLWLGVIGVCAGSMLAIYLASYLLTIVL